MSIDIEPEDSPFEAAMEAGWIDPVDVSKAMLDVMNERDRQWNEEHFDPTHDDRHVHGELVKAAVSYGARAAVTAELIAMGMPADVVEDKAQAAGVPGTWPWERTWWKPKGARRDLVRAAALLIAEIERLDRAETKAVQP